MAGEAIQMAYVDQFSKNLNILSQQQGSKLRKAVRTEEIHGKRGFFDGIGSTQAQKRGATWSDTNTLEVPQTRRMVVIEDYDWATFIDDRDKLKTIIDPASGYSQSASNALGRSMDNAIIEAALGIAKTGHNGTGDETFLYHVTDNKWYFPAAEVANHRYLKVDDLIKIRSAFGKSNVDTSNSSNKLYLVINQAGIDALLKDTKVVSADYANIKALVNGEVNSFMGFEIIRTELIGKCNLEGEAGSTHANGFAFAGSGLLLAINGDIKVSVDRRPDKNNVIQILATMSIGAVRMERDKVVGIRYEI